MKRERHTAEWWTQRAGNYRGCKSIQRGGLGSCSQHADPKDVDSAVRTANAAFESPVWRDMLSLQRCRLLNKFSDMIEENAEEIAIADTRPQGC